HFGARLRAKRRILQEVEFRPQRVGRVVGRELVRLRKRGERVAARGLHLGSERLLSRVQLGRELWGLALEEGEQSRDREEGRGRLARRVRRGGGARAQKGGRG